MDRTLILEGFGIEAGQTVIDLGCGPGFFTLPLAERVGPSGKVIALDTSEEMLRALAPRLRQAGRSNVQIERSEESLLPVPDQSVDRVLLAFVFHELRDPGTVFREIHRTLAPAGRIGLLEWKPVPSPFGPPIEERISEEATRRFLAGQAWRVVLAFEPNPYNYALLIDCPAPRSPGLGPCPEDR